MKFSIKLSELQDMLKFLRICVKPSSDEPSARINIRISNGEVFFVTSDAINSIKAVSKTSEITSEGSTAVLYSDVQPFINSFKSFEEGVGGVDDVLFKLNEKSLSISVKNFNKDSSFSKFNVRIPYFNEASEEGLFSFDNTDFLLGSSMLKATLDKISFTLDPLHNVTFLRGASLMFTENEIHFAGTNGIVISEYTVKNTSGVSDCSYIMSYDFVKGFRSILSSLAHKEETFISFYINKGKVKIKTDGIVFVGNLIIGYEFPDYRSELLREKKHKLVLSKDVLLSNLSPAVNLLDKDDNYRITFSYNGEEVCFFNDNFESRFDVEPAGKQDIKVDVNGKYLKQVISCINDEQIICMFSDENSAMCFDSEMFEDQKCLITPIKRRHE